MTGLPYIALCLWALIFLWGLRPLVQIITGRVHRHTWVPASLALFSLGVVALALDHVLHAPWLDPFGWANLILSACGLMATRALNAPDGHKRAVMLCHLGIVSIVGLVAYLGGHG